MRPPLVTQALCALTLSFCAEALGITPEERLEAANQISLLWENHLQNLSRFEKEIRENPSNKTLKNTFPQEKNLLLETKSGLSLPITLLVNTASQTPRPNEAFLLGGLVCPLEVLPTEHPHLSSDKKFLLFPNNPSTQEALSLGYPQNIPHSKIFRKLKSKKIENN